MAVKFCKQCRRRDAHRIESKKSQKLRKLANACFYFSSYMLYIDKIRREPKFPKNFRASPSFRIQKRKSRLRVQPNLQLLLYSHGCSLKICAHGWRVRSEQTVARLRIERTDGRMGCARDPELSSSWKLTITDGNGRTTFSIKHRSKHLSPRKFPVRKLDQNVSRACLAIFEHLRAVESKISRVEVCSAIDWHNATRFQFPTLP